MRICRQNNDAAFNAMEEGNNEMLEQLQGKVSMLKEVRRHA